MVLSSFHIAQSQTATSCLSVLTQTILKLQRKVVGKVDGSRIHGKVNLTHILLNIIVTSVQRRSSIFRALIGEINGISCSTSRAFRINLTVYNRTSVNIDLRIYHLQLILILHNNTCYEVAQVLLQIRIDGIQLSLHSLHGVIEGGNLTVQGIDFAFECLISSFVCSLQLCEG